ncbi:MAG: SRPBCC family protein [Leptolyngbya sp.]|nr:SRPBCC family protein [Leptolyngbya sp.]
MVGQIWAPSAPRPSTGGTLQPTLSKGDREALQRGDILLSTRSHGFSGGQVSATLAFALRPQILWDHLAHFPRWVDYLPDLVHSEVLPAAANGRGRVRQVGRKCILGFTAEAEVCLQVEALAPYRLRFELERGSLAEFTAAFTLTPWRQGTLVHFIGQAVPLLPIPGFVVEQTMRYGLPMNLRHMRQAIEGLAR